jgi:hypothetical protein
MSQGNAYAGFSSGWKQLLPPCGPHADLCVIKLDRLVTAPATHAFLAYGYSL